MLIYVQFTFDIFLVKWGSQNFEIGSGEPGHTHLWVILRFIRRKDPSSISVPNLKQIGQVIQTLRGTQNFEIGSRDPGHAHLGSFMVYTPEGSVLEYVCTKFEADRSIRSKVIRGSQNFEIASRDPGHAHLGVVL